MFKITFSLVFMALIVCSCQSGDTTSPQSSENDEKEGLETRRFYYALDLKNDSAKIEEYKHYHTPEGIWPEIPAGIKASGVIDMEIFLIGNRMVLMVEIPDSLNIDKVMETMGNLDRQSEWQEFTWQFQQALPMAKEGEKWIRMDKIFDLDDN